MAPRIEKGRAGCRRATRQAAVFLDRDGTLNEDVGYLDSLDRLTILPGAVEAVRLVNEAGLLAVVVTNQSGVARGLFDEAFLRALHRHMGSLFADQGALIDAFYYCPHHPTAGRGTYLKACNCRKPEPGMLLQAAREWGIDLERSYTIGDMPKDVLVGQRTGGKGILLGTASSVDDRLEGISPDFLAEDVLAAIRWVLGQADRMP